MTVHPLGLASLEVYHIVEGEPLERHLGRLSTAVGVAPCLKLTIIPLVLSKCYGA